MHRRQRLKRPRATAFSSACDGCGRNSTSEGFVLLLGACPRNCGWAWYCGRACQQSHWDEGHRTECDGSGKERERVVWTEDDEKEQRRLRELAEGAASRLAAQTSGSGKNVDDGETSGLKRKPAPTGSVLTQALKQDTLCTRYEACETPENPLRICGRCHSSYYCSRECAEEDWDDHQKYCKAIVAVGREGEQLVCARCGEVQGEDGKGLVRCYLCRQVCYCSMYCEMRHWMKHREVCDRGRRA